VRDEKTLQHYVRHDDLRRRKLLDKCRRTVSEGFSELRGEQASSLRDELQEAIRTENIQELTVAHLAEKAELLDIYLVVYSLLCGSVHSTSRDLVETFAFDQTKRIIELNAGPSMHDAYLDLCTACQSMALALAELGTVLSLDVAQTVTSHMTEASQILSRHTGGANGI
jgi:hypothetical protein